MILYVGLCKTLRWANTRRGRQSKVPGTLRQPWKPLGLSKDAFANESASCLGSRSATSGAELPQTGAEIGDGADHRVPLAALLDALRDVLVVRLPQSVGANPRGDVRSPTVVPDRWA